MKGVIFVELLAMAEDAFGEDVVDRIIDSAALPSRGAYTSVGNYDCEELLELVRGFSAYSGVSQAELQRLFGHWMMRSFGRHYPEFFVGKSGSIEMLEAIEDEIHVEVRKLYPEAELPAFDTVREGKDVLELTYSSPRPLADFCGGLIEGCVARFGETADIERSNRDADGLTIATFRIRTGIET